VASELYRLLSKTARLEDYVPPPLKVVVLKSLGVYAIVAFLASMTTWGVLPLRANAIGGMGCLPLEYSHESSLFFWIVFVPAFIGFPSCYIGFVTYKVLCGGMLSPLRRLAQRGPAVRPAGQGDACGRASARQARALTMYFARIVVVYFAIWIPCVLILYVFDLRDQWLAFAGGTFAHLQGMVSAGMALSKPDVSLAVLQLYTCSCWSGGVPTGFEDKSEDKFERWGFIRRTRDVMFTMSLRSSPGTSAAGHYGGSFAGGSSAAGHYGSSAQRTDGHDERNDTEGMQR